LRSRNSSIPTFVEDAVLRALAKDPADRFVTAAEFVEALASLAVAVPPPGRKAIVVLPFLDLVADPQTDYFADGLTDELITNLSKVRTLRVISRSSAMRLKGTQRDTKRIASDLNVQFVLDGTVRRDGGSLRIDAQLIDAVNDITLWADKYVGGVDEILQIQEALAKQIVDALKLTITPEERNRLEERPIKDAHAYEAYLRAGKELWQLSEASLDRGVQLLRNALEIVGENPLLYATLGHVYAQYVWGGVRVDPTYLTKAEECVHKVFTLQPDSPHGQLLRGIMAHKVGDFPTAVTNLKAVLEVADGNPDALLYLGYTYALSGRETASRALFTRLLEADPLTPVNYCTIGFLEVLEGHPERALEPYARLYHLDPTSPFAAWTYAWALAWNQRLDEQAVVVQRLAQDAPNTVFASLSRLLNHATHGEHQEALEAVTAEAKAAALGTEMFSRELAHGYAVAGAVDEALDWLEQANRLGLTNYPFLARHDRMLDHVRANPRFQQLLQRIKHQWETHETSGV
jgi:eukaryotic-like serine/threonine-protein kinase